MTNGRVPNGAGSRTVVVVLNWCGEEDTAACLDSLAAASDAEVEVLLVDNGSPDGSGDRLHARYPHLAYLQTGANLGFTGGNNRGIEWAMARGAEYVVVLNNDTVVAADCIARLVRTADEAPNAGAVAPTMLVHDAPDRVWFAGGTMLLLRGLGRHDGEGERDRGADAVSGPTPVSFLTGCCILLTRRAIETVGTFEESFFAYGEDVDLSFRLTRAGFTLLHEPRARLWHRVPVTATEPTPFQIEQRDRNRRRFVHLRLTAPRRAAFCAWFYPTRFVHLVRYTLRGDRARAAAIIRGAFA